MSTIIARTSTRRIPAAYVAALLLAAAAFLGACTPRGYRDRLPAPRHDLVFDNLASTWDEGIPLGNGMIGALVWKKGDSLRMSLDRADLWDLRPVAGFSGPEFSFAWVRDHVVKNDYEPVHKMGDMPYDRDPAPTKIPAAALEFDISSLGEVGSVRLSLADAVCRVVWKSGARLTAFVHATEPVGWFQFEGLPGGVRPKLVPPSYAAAAPADGSEKNSLNPGSLARLGYPEPELEGDETAIRYHQECWGGMSYEVAVDWDLPEGGVLTGVWSISSIYPETEAGPAAWGTGRELAPNSAAPGARARARPRPRMHTGPGGRPSGPRQRYVFPTPCSRSSGISRPTSSARPRGAARRRSPSRPSGLPTTGTCRRGRATSTMTSTPSSATGPAYSGNHLEEGQAFLDWLWAIKPRCEEYTRRYFGVDGLNVPGVAALDGAPMGGWIQYSLGPTVSAWLAHHFWLHWRYSGDRAFLEERAYPYLKGVAVFLDNIAERSADGKRKLPLSSSPEINDNRIDAWFRETTNYDLALVRWLYGAASAMADELGLAEEGERWRTILGEWPDSGAGRGRRAASRRAGLSLSRSRTGISRISWPSIRWVSSTRAGARPIKGRSVPRSPSSTASGPTGGADILTAGSATWPRGRATARRPRKLCASFAECFCLPNSFHANGDQTKSGRSKMTYRPFTLEGNFAFASGIQEMLLQSHTGVVRVFPAVPDSWPDVSFDSLRAEGAFLVSATRKAGKVAEVRIRSEKGGRLRLENPFPGLVFKASGAAAGTVPDGARLVEAEMRPGDTLVLKAI